MRESCVTTAIVLAAANEMGWPAGVVPAGGEVVEIEPTPTSWIEFGVRYERDIDALEAALAVVAGWERHFRRQLGEEVTLDA